MEDWYNVLQGPRTTTLFVSDTGHSNTEIALEWLDHFIREIQAGIPFISPVRLLLLDGHSSHISQEFRKRAEACNIHVWQFPSHLTHAIQPLDVGVFQPYKHWHSRAITNAMYSFQPSYDLYSFLRDLNSIREARFTHDTITSAWRKSGLWPVNKTKVLERIKQWQRPSKY